MINTQKQIDYWKNGAISDIDTAEILLSKNKLKECLFFCHLTIEKILKAHYSKIYNEVPPKTHNLYHLVEKNNISTDDTLKKYLGTLMKYQIEGRYPEYHPVITNKDFVSEILLKTKEVLQWLMKML